MRYLQLFLLALCVTLAVPALAQKDVTRQELTNFDRFLDSHPAIEKDLQTNPALVRDSAYLSSHPDLKQFLDTHPGVREEIRENPSRFMKTERHFERTGKDLTRPEVKAFDDFLDTHQAIDKDLSKHPALVNDPTYLANHPDLRNFLNSHPAIRQDLAGNPRVFMHAEKRFDKAERKQSNAADRREDRNEDKAERQERREERREKPQKR